jgi:acyl carrier protein
LGGHSLLAMRVISLVRKELDVEIAIHDLFEFTTISDLSRYLEIQLKTGDEENREFELIDI